MEKWLADLSDGIEGIIYRQWSALGAFLAEEASSQTVVDPEALLVATCTIGRSGPRIFDEMLDWLIQNERFAARFIRSVRLKTIAESFGSGVGRVLAAVTDYASASTRKDLLPAMRAMGREGLETAPEEELFFSSKDRLEQRAANPTFLRWKLVRGEPRIRRHSGRPDMENPANVMTAMRQHYGPSVKADILTYLLTGRPGNSYTIARKIRYNQSSVYRELEKMVEDGLLNKYGSNYQKQQGGPYWVDRARMASVLGWSTDELPVFLAWPDIFLAYHMIFSDWREHSEDYRKEFFQAERMRDLAVKVVPLIREAGEPLSLLATPDISRLKGLQHKDKLVSFLREAMSVIESAN